MCHEDPTAGHPATTVRNTVDTNDADEVMANIGRALELGQAGDRANARDALTELWGRIGYAGDAVHRCTVAHHLADLQESVADELMWDRRALAAVADLDDQRVQRHDVSLRVRAFLPSLHLNLADGYRRAGDVERARHHVTVAAPLVAELPDDGYGAMIRDAISRVTGLLDTGSREPLAAP
ncbi:hypothetical protein GA0070608_4599 [Micromonospora peucetia]|uniref:Tetratricopeptide repeat-containing protein n=2 Tax=Micromonospora peucetia TaxID=47871 RepID=A0A1C6VYB6_9ACTN|nr:hypothetical protein GA0070608_4599 [Micromonospora peucetia]